MATIDEIQRLLMEERRAIEKELGISEGANEIEKVAAAAKAALKRGREKTKRASEPVAPMRRSSR